MSRLIVVFAVVAAATSVLPIPEAGAVVICQKKNKITLRPDTCKGKETRVMLGTDAVASPAQLLAAVKSADGSGSGLDADTLDGKDSSAFLDVGGKAADADKLDGKDSSEFGPVAYAHVGADGTLDAAHSKNVTATSLYTIPMFFYYCIDVAVPFKNIIVTPDNMVPTIAVAEVGDPITSCAPYTMAQAVGDITVQTFNASGSAVGSGFWILLN